MIKRIDLELFKCFDVLKLPLEPLTLLSGANASGKSTVLQALVLLHQTVLEHEWSTRLQLNGSELQLGCVADVVDKIHGRRHFTIGIVDAACSVHWLFAYGGDKQAMSVKVTSVAIEAGGRTQKVTAPPRLRFLLPEIGIDGLSGLSRKLQRLNYLTAERVGPREHYQLQDPSATQVVGPRGENAVGLLHLHRDQKVLPSLALASDPPTLLSQVVARMRQFFQNVSLEVQHVPQTNIVSSCIPGRTCWYTSWVSRQVEWPRRSDTTLVSSPASSRRVALLWRRS